MRATVDPYDADAILNVTFPLNNRRDTLIWPHSRDGRASVRSVYHNIRQGHNSDDENPGQHCANEISSVWQDIWKAKV